MNKMISDFIEYAYSNLIWFAFNFVLVFMPLVAMFVIHTESKELNREDNDMSYGVLLYVVSGVNFVQFVLRPAIYEEKLRKSVYSNEQ